MANKTVLVAQREYLENVRTKTFWIGILIVPILIGLSVGATALLQRFKQTQRYTVLDLGGADLLARAEREFRSGDTKVLFDLARTMQDDPQLASLRQQLGPGGGATEPGAEQLLATFEWMQRQPPELLDRLAKLQTAGLYHYVPLAALGIDGADDSAREHQLNQRVQKGELFAYFVLGKAPNEDTKDFRYVSNNLTDDALRSAYASALTRLVQKDRIQQAGIAPAVAKKIQERVEFQAKQVDASGATADVKKENVIDKWAPMGFVYFLWLAIFSIANLLLTNTIEEKGNRTIEVLLSSVSPGQLMQGKIWGIAATGMTIVGTWVGFGLLAAWIAPTLLGMPVDGGGMLAALFTALRNSGYLLAFVFYFLGGFLLYAAVLVAIGSVCNTLKEAQNLMQPVMMVLMVPLLSMVFVTQEPNGIVARVMSWVPLFTPFTMMNRAGGPPAVWEYVGTSLLLLVTIWLAMKGAGKIFRVGVLMTGNPPKLKEIFGWLRQS
ncbi:MAG: ABC transporter permease [Planctomycetes bacterium]|nr:ABC transporter permease [Planctomycetota bacterium]